MNWQHLRAFLWLRWRLLVNQMRRGGFANTLILGILAAAGVVLAVILFATAFLLGYFLLSSVSSPVVLYVWDGVVIVFLFSWMIGLLVELQRSEVLSLSKILHLPVSPRGAFLINYLSSLISVNMVVFLPPMLGLTLALIFGRGPVMLLLLPLLAAFLLMVTALTYQFQGWLAALMVNQRRRRTVIVFVTLGFILLCQAPQLIINNVVQPGKGGKRQELAARHAEQQSEIQQSLAEHKITAPESQQRLEEIRKYYETQLQELNEQTWQDVAHAFRLVNLWLPPGWLPLGAMAAADGKVLPGLLGTLGLTLLGAASLWRAYRTTLRLYTGQFSSGKARTAPAAPAVVTGATAGSTTKTAVGLLERELPWLSEHASVIALGGLRSMLRAPEAKMLLLAPIILTVVFGSLFIRRTINVPEAARPLLAYGASAIILLTMIQLVGNQFGFDRSGFRVFVLCSAPRNDILLGKNLAVAPIALGMCGLAVIFIQIIYPMRLDYFLATLLQLVSMYLLFCLVANLMSIFAPMPIAAGSLKPVNPKLVPVLLQLLFVTLFFIVMPWTLLPLGVAFLVEQLTGVKWLPVCLILSVVECVGVAYFYRLALTWEGNLLHAREQKILEIVTTKAE